MQTQKECTQTYIRPVRDALDIINGKWKLPIIVSLSLGRKRFNQLEKDLGGVTPKMLSKELKDLEVNQLIKRTVFHTNPVTVEYSLTEYGKSLDAIILPLHHWGKEHRTRLFLKTGAAPSDSTPRVVQN